jgi:hypothetical protein
MRRGTNKLRAAAAALVFSGAVASAPEAKAVDLDELSMKELCKQGFFEGVMETEQKSQANETAAISKAKN